MDQSQLRKFEAQCIQEEPPACQTGCPIHVEARAFIALMAQGKLAEARRLLDRTMPLSGILGCLCSGPCRLSCRRSEIDEGIDMPMLERFCVSQTRQTKPFPLPGTGKLVSIAGSGLSSLVTAFELGKKGHPVNIFYPTGPIGGFLRRPDHVNEARLAPGCIDDAIEMLEQLRVTFIEIPLASFNQAWLDERLAESEAVYIGLDEPQLESGMFGPEFGPEADAPKHVTLETGRPKVFMGGSGQIKAINNAFDGKKAFLSIDRVIQGVNPATMRENEGPYPTRLYTSLSGIAAQNAANIADPLNPTADEARAEAERCIQCQCLECVKNCAFLRNYKAYPKRYAREIYNNLSVVQGTRQANTMINSCAECGLCAALCPLQADTGALCDLAREEMVSTGKMPASMHEFALDDMNFSNGADIAFARHQPGTTASRYLFFPGCQLPASMPEETSAAYDYLCASLDGGIGLWFGCCGSPARWGARRLLGERNAKAMRKTWEDMGKPEVILACASCVAQFKETLPEIPARSLWELMAALPLPAGAAPAPERLALHDPCPARHNQPMLDGIRSILRGLGQELQELPLSGSLTRCCGYGGLASQGNPAVAEAMSRDRAADTEHTLLSYCSMCRDRLAMTQKPSLHALNLLFPKNGGTLNEAAARPVPGISDRQHSRRAFRQEILQRLWGEKPAQDEAMDKIKLKIPGAVAEKLERRRILHSDIKSVLMREDSAQFKNSATGRTLSCYRPKNVTFWVEHSLAPDGAHIIHDAYTHRMTVPGVPAAPHDPAVIGEQSGDYGDGGFYKEKP